MASDPRPPHPSSPDPARRAGDGRPVVGPEEANRRIAGHSGPHARPLVRPDERTPGMFRALLGLTVASAILYAAMLLQGLRPGAAEGIAATLPADAPRSPAMTAESIQGALTGSVWFAVLLGLAGYALVLVGLVRRSNTARVIGAILAALAVFATLLGAIRMFVFPAGDLVLPLVLGLLFALVNAAWLVCAFNPGLATTFIRGDDARRRAA